MTRLIIFLFFCWVSLPDACQAGSFHVSPVRVELSDSITSSVLTVRNNGDTPVTIQLQVMAWSQLHGTDQLLPTREVLATPAIFRLKPGLTQIVRLGLLRKADVRTELSYRLFLEEIPPPATADFKGLQVALRIGVPVFIKPASSAIQSLQFTAAQPAEGPLYLTIKNNGTAHAQLLGLQVYPFMQPDFLLANYDSALYLLPGQERMLPLSIGGQRRETGSSLLIKAQTRAGPVEFHAVLSGS